MTFLELVNAVLVRIRETQVTSVNEEDYSSMVAAYCNDAKRLVEDAWQWSALRETIEIGTADGTATYSLTDTGSRATIESVSLPTENYFLTQKSKRWLIEKQFNTTMSTSPTNWVQDGTDANGDSQVSFWPTPDGNYSVNIEAFVRQPSLVLDDDVLQVPAYPVQQLAVAMVARERGEVGGQTSAELFQLAQQGLADAIGHDYAKFDAQLDWYV